MKKMSEMRKKQKKTEKTEKVSTSNKRKRKQKQHVCQTSPERISPYRRGRPHEKIRLNGERIIHQIILNGMITKIGANTSDIRETEKKSLT